MEQVKPLEVYFGTIKCDCEWIDFIPNGITFSIKSPIKCYPTLKYTGDHAITTVKWSRIRGQGCSVDGCYLIIHSKTGSIDDFDEYNGTGHFDPGSLMMFEKLIFVRFDHKMRKCIKNFPKTITIKLDRIYAYKLHGELIKRSSMVSRGTQWCTDDIAILIEDDDEASGPPPPPSPKTAQE